MLNLDKLYYVLIAPPGPVYGSSHLATEGQRILLKERTPSVGMIPEARTPYCILVVIDGQNIQFNNYHVEYLTKNVDCNIIPVRTIRCPKLPQNERLLVHPLTQGLLSHFDRISPPSRSFHIT
jgi:hypothetical protein